MFYREAGQFKTSYAADQAIFPIRQDRIGVFALLAVAFFVVPFTLTDFTLNAVWLPFLIYSLAALGLNILTGYCGQVSLGTGAFMGVGAYSAFKLMTAFPELNIVAVFLASGLITAAVGMLFGLPSLRIKGFYLAVATLAAQFFLVWLFYKWGWLRNYSNTGQISVPPRDMLGFTVTGPHAGDVAKYLLTLSIVVLLALAAKNMVRGRLGRAWMAIRDMDIAAELMGIRPLQTKLSAFGVSSFYIGVAGAMLFSIYLGAAEAGETFGIQPSFNVLFMIIIGGLGTIMGSFLGAGFLVLLPLFLRLLFIEGLGVSAVVAQHAQLIVLGMLIILFLILEPHGLARLWQTIKEKLRLWPYPH
ncbi:MAG TPA: branched-chain amino acid ABC transporter permease [Hyphomicrobiaceae bacterium]|nr:branched-chain amino acid ABC transporter permease [Hyphomicrobiaceae bacterium]